MKNKMILSVFVFLFCFSLIMPSIAFAQEKPVSADDESKPEVKEASNENATEDVKAKEGNGLEGIFETNKLELIDKNEESDKGKIKYGELEFDIDMAFEFEYVDVENEPLSLADMPKEPQGHFQIDRMMFAPYAKLGKRAKLYTEMDIYRDVESTTKDQQDYLLKKAYFEYYLRPFPFSLRLGLQDREFRMDRESETYPISGSMFWGENSQFLGLTYSAKFDNTSFFFSFANGLQLSDGYIGKDASFPIIIDNRDSSGRNDLPEVTLGFSKKWYKSPYKLFFIQPFYIRNKLSDTDVTYLQSIAGYGPSVSNARNRYGVNLSAMWGKLKLDCEYISARDGEMTRNVWYFQPSYTRAFRNSFWVEKITFLARYNSYDTNLTRNISDARTWDRDMVTFSMISTISDYMTFKMEYNFNEEDTGGADIDNDEMLFNFTVTY